MGERSSICCVGARSTLHEQQTHQKLGRAVAPAMGNAKNGEVSTQQAKFAELTLYDVG
jgi:hypothetical protein